VLQAPRSVQGREARALSSWSLEVRPLDHSGYLELLGELPALLELVATMAPGTREIIVKHAVRTTEGMAQVVSRADERGNLRLTSLQDLQDYCYLVAGIVGELLTEVFLHGSAEFQAEQAALRMHMLAFGEGLQLVNILKDASDDARDGRVYLPAQLPRAEVFLLARADLDAANRYARSLQRGGVGRRAGTWRSAGCCWCWRSSRSTRSRRRAPAPGCRATTWRTCSRGCRRPSTRGRSTCTVANSSAASGQSEQQNRNRP